MPKLNLEPRLQNPDSFYRELAKLHEGVSIEESVLINAKLIFMLANHIGDHDVLMEALSRLSANPSVGEKKLKI